MITTTTMTTIRMTDVSLHSRGSSLPSAPVLFFSSSGVSVQILERRIEDFELNIFRNIVPLILYSVGFVIARKFPLIERDKIPVTALYLLFVFCDGVGFYISISLLPAALAACLRNVSCVISGLFLFSFFWKESIRVGNSCLVIICVLGILLLIQPWHSSIIHRTLLPEVHSEGYGVLSSNTSSDIPSHNSSEYYPCDTEMTHDNSTLKMLCELTLDRDLDNSSQSKQPEDYRLETMGRESSVLNPYGVTGKVIGYCSGIIAGVALTADILVMKRNPYIYNNVFSVLMWVFIVNIIISTGLMFIFETPTLPRDWFDTLMVTIHSLSCTLLWPLYMYGTKYISGNTFALIWSLDLVFMLLFQYTFLSSVLPGHRNWMEVMGVLLVLLGSSLSSIFEMIEAKKSNLN